MTVVTGYVVDNLLKVPFGQIGKIEPHYDLFLICRVLILCFQPINNPLGRFTLSAVDACLDRFAKLFELQGLHSFLLFEQSESGANDLAGVIITPLRKLLLDKLFKVLTESDAGWHGFSLLTINN